MLPIALLFAIHIAPPAESLPYKQPQLAAGDGLVAMTFGAGKAVYCAVSRDQGKTFAAPVKVAEGGHLALGRRRGPRIAISRGTIVVSAIVGEKGGGRDGDLVAWRSADGGKTWAGPVTVNSVPGAAREGLHGMAAGDGRVMAAWLDLRKGGTRLAASVSRDGGATWSENRMAYESPDGNICECCHPSVAMGRDGRVFLMWRNALAGARDMYLASSADGGATFRVEKLGQGSWPLKACPMDGGGVVEEAGGKAVTAWRRDRSVFLSRPGRAEEELGLGKDPAIAASNGKTYVVWESPEGLKLRVSGEAENRLLAPHGAVFPSLVTAGGRVLAAWEDRGAIVVETLP